MRGLLSAPGRYHVVARCSYRVQAVTPRCWGYPHSIRKDHLNIAQFGDGIYGTSAASVTFFGKRPSELEQQEAALLAAVLPNPIRLHVRNPSAYVRERAGWIEEQMAQLGGPAYLQNL